MADDRADNPKVPVVLVAGMMGETARKTADGFLNEMPGTAVVHHDLRQVAEGIVRRCVRYRPLDPAEPARRDDVVLELAHGCVSCTLREDVLPLLRLLAQRADVTRIVLQLDPALEPESVCWCIEHLALDEDSNETAGDYLWVEAVVAVIETASWLDDATCDEDMADRGLAAGPDDERSVASVLLGQTEFADLLVLAGPAADAWTQVRTRALLDRVAPGAPLVTAPGALADPAGLLALIPPRSRRGRIDDPYGPVLRGEPPLTTDCGVSLTLFSDRRPFHPARLHAALQRLIGAVVRTRGVLWIASRPDTALRLETAGVSAMVGEIGPWLVASDPGAWDGLDPQQQAMAALDWDPYYGDRRQEIAVISHEMHSDDIADSLRAALLTDAEIADGEAAWCEYDDTFGRLTTDPSDTDDLDSDPADISVPGDRKDQL